MSVTSSPVCYVQEQENIDLFSPLKYIFYKIKNVTNSNMLMQIKEIL